MPSSIPAFSVAMLARTARLVPPNWIVADRAASVLCSVFGLQADEKRHAERVGELEGAFNAQRAALKKDADEKGASSCSLGFTSSKIPLTRGHAPRPRLRISPLACLCSILFLAALLRLISQLLTVGVFDFAVQWRDCRRAWRSSARSARSSSANATNEVRCHFARLCCDPCESFCELLRCCPALETGPCCCYRCAPCRQGCVPTHAPPSNSFCASCPLSVLQRASLRRRRRARTS